jgi:hypothetical protein
VEGLFCFKKGEIYCYLSDSGVLFVERGLFLSAVYDVEG